MQGEVAVPVRFGYNILSLHSAAFVTTEGGVLLGTDAEDRRLEDPAMFRREFKRDLGSGTPFRFGPLALTAEELVARLFAKVREEASAQAPELGPPDEAVITVPATYQETRRRLMREAGLAAGF